MAARISLAQYRALDIPDKALELKKEGHTNVENFCDCSMTIRHANKLVTIVLFLAFVDFISSFNNVISRFSGKKRVIFRIFL